MSHVQFALVKPLGGSVILRLSHPLALLKAKSVNLKVVLCPVSLAPGLKIIHFFL